MNEAYRKKLFVLRDKVNQTGYVECSEQLARIVTLRQANPSREMANVCSELEKLLEQKIDIYLKQ